MSDTVLSGEYHADVTELASQVRELQAENERLNDALDGALVELTKEQERNSETCDRMFDAHRDLEAEQHRRRHLSERLDQYESTPERGLKAVMDAHQILFELTASESCARLEVVSGEAETLLLDIETEKSETITAEDIG